MGVPTGFETQDGFALEITGKKFILTFIVVVSLLRTWTDFNQYGDIHSDVAS